MRLIFYRGFGFVVGGGLVYGGVTGGTEDMLLVDATLVRGFELGLIREMQRYCESVGSQFTEWNRRHYGTHLDF